MVVTVIRAPKVIAMKKALSNSFHARVVEERRAAVDDEVETSELLPLDSRQVIRPCLAKTTSNISTYCWQENTRPGAQSMTARIVQSNPSAC